jgi:hypothetical protein
MTEFGFDDLPQLLEQYAATHLPSDSYSYHRVLVAEAKKRLRQLWRLSGIVLGLCNRISALKPQINALPPLDTPDPPQEVLEWIEAIDSLEMYTEAFYYLAWRLRQVIRTLPGLKSFDALGIRLARNHLIEHPEKHGQDVLWAFTISDTEGPILLRASTSDDRKWDKGLWPNVMELTQRLREALRAAIAN